MPKTLIFTKLAAGAEPILDELGRRAGLPCRDAEDRRIFDFEGADRDVDPIAELHDIDPSWQDHVRLENPQT
jgi:hypothetical protein